MHCIVRPLANSRIRLDVGDCLVDAIARELGRRCGGNAMLNRLEAEAHLANLLRRHRVSAGGGSVDGPAQIEDTNEEMNDAVAPTSDRSV